MYSRIDKRVIEAIRWCLRVTFRVFGSCIAHLRSSIQPKEVNQEEDEQQQQQQQQQQQNQHQQQESLVHRQSAEGAFHNRTTTDYDTVENVHDINYEVTGSTLPDKTDSAKCENSMDSRKSCAVKHDQNCIDNKNAPFHEDNFDTNQYNTDVLGAEADQTSMPDILTTFTNCSNRGDGIGDDVDSKTQFSLSGSYDVVQLSWLGGNEDASTSM